MIFGTFFTIDSAFLEGMLGYMKNLFSDFSPILLIVLGLSLGLWIVYNIIKSVRIIKHYTGKDE